MRGCEMGLSSEKYGDKLERERERETKALVDSRSTTRVPR